MDLPDKFKFEVVGEEFPVYFAMKLNSTVYEVSWKDNDKVESCPYTVPSVESIIKTGKWKIIKEEAMDIAGSQLIDTVMIEWEE